ERGLKIVEGRYLPSTHRNDNVTQLLKRAAIERFTNDRGTQPGRGRAAVPADIGDDDAFSDWKVECANNIPVQRSRGDSQPRTRDITLTYDLGDDPFRQIHLNGETNADGAASSIRLNRCIDANHFASHIQQRSTGVTWVDCGIGLDSSIDRPPGNRITKRSFEPADD